MPTNIMIDAIEHGNAIVRRNGLAFEITFAGALDHCDCYKCSEQIELFDYLQKHCQPQEQKEGDK